MSESGALPLPDQPPKITDRSKLPHNVNIARYWLRRMREQLKGATDDRPNRP